MVTAFYFSENFIFYGCGRIPQMFFKKSGVLGLYFFPLFPLDKVNQRHHDYNQEQTKGNKKTYNYHFRIGVVLGLGHRGSIFRVYVCLTVIHSKTPVVKKTHVNN